MQTEMIRDGTIIYFCIETDKEGNEVSLKATILRDRITDIPIIRPGPPKFPVSPCKFAFQIVYRLVCAWIEADVIAAPQREGGGEN